MSFSGTNELTNGMNVTCMTYLIEELYCLIQNLYELCFALQL